MDIISGLNKVICHALSEEDNGKVVTISNGTNVWSATVENQLATFLIPSIPVPARKVYTISMGSDFVKDVQMGYGEVMDVFLDDGYEVVLHKDFDEFKESAETSIEKIKGQLKDSEIEFRFGVDAQGRYGYKKAGADSVTPFRTGQETFCYYLGTGRSFDIQAACANIKNVYGIDLDYKTLTAANFAVSNTAYGGTFTEYWEPTNTYGVTQDVYINYAAPVVTYNAVTGTATVTGAGLVGLSTHRSVGGSGAGGRNWGNVDFPVAAYLIKKMN